jgi:hypothetical protein
METITLSVNKMAIIIALVTGLIVGGIIGMVLGAHHGRFEGRGNFKPGYDMDMRVARPMMDNTKNANTMMQKVDVDATQTLTPPAPTVVPKQ